MSPITITVVIVSYKSAQLTIDALQSVDEEKNRHTHLNIKVVVVDNDSGDAPAINKAVLNNHWADWVKVLASPINGGFGYGNNYGFNYALDHWQVDYFHLLNPDAQLRPNALNELVKFMATHPNVGITGSSFETLDGEIWPYAFRFPGLCSEFDSALSFGPVSKLLKRKALAVTMGEHNAPIDWIAGASMMIRKEVVQSLNGFDENYFLYYEETDFCLRAYEAGYETWYIPSSRVMHILGQSTKVTEIVDKPKRLPSYWFESRSRYFQTHHGAINAAFIDIATVLGYQLKSAKSSLKKFLGKTSDERIPFYTQDLTHHSALFSANRNLNSFMSQLEKSK